jgi:hypothetical protein
LFPASADKRKFFIFIFLLLFVMSNNQEGPSRADVRAASKKSADMVSKWNRDNATLVDAKNDVVVLLEEQLASEDYSGHFGATVPSLRILCSLIPGAPEQRVANSLTKVPLVQAMLTAARAMGVAVSQHAPGEAAANQSGEGASPYSKPVSISVSDWAVMQKALKVSQEVVFSSSSEDSDEPSAVAVKKAGEVSFLYRYRIKDVVGLSKAEIFDGVSKDLAEELLFSNGMKHISVSQAREREASIAKCLPVMVKKVHLHASVLSSPSDFYVKSLEAFLTKHKGWRAHKESPYLGRDSSLSKARKQRRKSSKRSRRFSSSDSDAPNKKAPAILAFAREAKKAEAIRQKDIEKGIALKNIFKVWRKGTDKVLPYKALKFIGKEVASPLSEFLHPTRGVYNTPFSASQTELRDTKLRNIFEDVVYKLIPGREVRLNEFKAAEALRGKGADLAKAARKRREKSESVLLSRLALECELCMMGAKSWSEFDGTLRGDGVAEAIRTSLVDSAGSESDEGAISLKTAAAAWRRAMAAKVAPLRTKQGSGEKSRGQSRTKTDAQLLVASMQSGFATLRNSLANGGWAVKGNGGGGRRGGSTNQKGGAGGPSTDRPCWQCGKHGHTWWQKSECPLAGKDPAPGTKHAAKNAARTATVKP